MNYLLIYRSLAKEGPWVVHYTLGSHWVSGMINTSKTLSAQQLLLPWRYKQGKHYQCSEYTLKVQTLIEKQNRHYLIAIDSLHVL